MAVSYSNQYQWTFDLLYNDLPVIPTGWADIRKGPKMSVKDGYVYDPIVGDTIWSPGQRYWEPLSLIITGPAAKELGENMGELFLADKLDICLKKWHGVILEYCKIVNVKAQNIEWMFAEELKEMVQATFLFEKAYYYHNLPDNLKYKTKE